MSNMVINVIHKPISLASQHAQISPMSGITESGQMTTCVAWCALGVQELRGRDPGTLERVLDGESTHGIPSPGWQLAERWSAAEPTPVVEGTGSEFHFQPFS